MSPYTRLFVIPELTGVAVTAITLIMLLGVVVDGDADIATIIIFAAVMLPIARCAGDAVEGVVRWMLRD